MNSTTTTVTKRDRELSRLQVQEYVSRYYPELRDRQMEISPCGNFASVRGQ